MGDPNVRLIQPGNGSWCYRLRKRPRGLPLFPRRQGKTVKISDSNFIKFADFDIVYKVM